MIWILLLVLWVAAILLIAQFVSEDGGDSRIAIASALTMFTSGVLLLSI